MMVRLVIAFSLITSSIFAQNTKVFEDEFGKKGVYKFSGNYSDTTLPKQGLVDIQWRENENNQLKTYRVKGQTKDYLPIGKWSWEEADWSYQINAGTSINPSFNAVGKRMKWEGNFSVGTPEGKWIFTLDSISNTGKSNGNLIKTEIQFKKGIPVGAFTIDDNYNSSNLKVKGTCDENGAATGLWSFSYRDENQLLIKEERKYEKGMLLEIKIQNKTVKLFRESVLNEWVQIGSLDFSQDLFGGIVSELYHENLTQYFQKGWTLSVFPFDFKRKIPVFKRLEYRLKPQEIDDILVARQLLQKQKNTIDGLLAGNISIHRSRSGELDTTIAFLQLHYNRLNFIDSILNKTDLPFFTYKNRYECCNDIEKWLNELNELRFAKGEVYDSLSIELPEIQIPTDSIFIFHIFRTQLIQNEENFVHYFKTVEDAHISVKQEGELKALENEIVAKYENQKAFYQNHAGISEVIYSNWVAPLFHDYVLTDEYEDALRKGNEVLIQLDSLDRWQAKVDKFDAMPEILKAKYTYLAYNPYTGKNEIEIVNKRRFLTAVQTILWPYLLNEIQHEKNWNNWVVLWERQFKLFHFLMDFSTQEDAHAKRINKRIRKEKKPERILKILSF